ncbi:helix-turn-helix transcriptional regulator [Streptomyces sp. NPDC059832]|uniref:helix-turn-helix transcriptional regulator n=1 Tax=unclassified Streptomyces TaxID=2593676 RepID=UPI003666ADEC
MTLQTDPPRLSPRRRQTVSLNALGLSPYEMAEELGISPAGVRIHLRDARLSAGTETDRALTYQVLAGGDVDLSRLPTSPAGLLDEPTCLVVLRGLRYDVPDHQLVTTIARAADTHPDAVREALNNLRCTTRLSDCGLLGLAFAAGILSGREGVSPPSDSTPARAAAVSTPGTHRPIPPGRAYLQQFPPQPTPRPRPPVDDPLKLLPEILSAQKTGTRHPLRCLQGRTAVAGADVQPVRVSIEVCRDVLQRLHGDKVSPQQWGPVLASSEGRYTVFMLRPGSLPDQWRYASSRVLKCGTALHLPPHTAASGPLYWAVPPAVWWNPHTLMPLITGTPRRPQHTKEWSPQRIHGLTT